MAFKAKNICYLALYKNMFATNPCFIGYSITLHTLYRMQVCGDGETLRLYFKKTQKPAWLCLW